MSKFLYQEQQIGGSVANGLPVGTIIAWITAINPVGFLECDGSAVSRTLYPDLFNLIGTAFGAGDNETTFNLPNMNGRFLEGSDVAGTLKEAGIPNITGHIAACVTSYARCTPASGAFSYLQSGNKYNSDANYPAAGSYGGWGYDIDASRLSSVYGNSTTVQPRSITVRYLIKAFDTQIPDTYLLDITECLQSLAHKLERSQIPAYNCAVILTTSGTYITPVTGWYEITLIGGGGGGSAGFMSTNYYSGGGGGGQGGKEILTLYIAKNTSLSYTIGAAGVGGTKPTANNQIMAGTVGGNTTITINSTTYTAYGGAGGNAYSGGNGGSGTYPGVSGQNGIPLPMINPSPSAIFGLGGGSYNDYGSGGAGGWGEKTYSNCYAGNVGKPGCIRIKYFQELNI